MEQPTKFPGAKCMTVRATVVAVGSVWMLFASGRVRHPRHQTTTNPAKLRFDTEAGSPSG